MDDPSLTSNTTDCSEGGTDGRSITDQQYNRLSLGQSVEVKEPKSRSLRQVESFLSFQNRY